MRAIGSTPTGTITELLQRMRSGDSAARERLFSVVHQELRAIARRQMRGLRGNDVMNVTAVVNEACARVMERGALAAEDRAHFFYVFARAMRDALIDALRAERAAKRGGDRRRVPLVDFEADGDTQRLNLLDLQEALRELKDVDAESALIVDLRFFNNLTLQQAAESMGCSFATARRHWDYAKAWLSERLSRNSSPSQF